MIVIALIAIITDSILALTTPKGDTFSEVIEMFYRYTGGFFYVLGYIITHLGWYGKNRRSFVVSMSVLLAGLIVFTMIQYSVTIMPIWWVFPGMLFGRLFWPQVKQITEEK